MFIWITAHTQTIPGFGGLTLLSTLTRTGMKKKEDNWNFGIRIWKYRPQSHRFSIGWRSSQQISGPGTGIAPSILRTVIRANPSTSITLLKSRLTALIITM